jgi:hypothetical protein
MKDESRSLPATFVVDPGAPPYERLPRSKYRVKLTFQVQFTNGGHVRGAGFLLDIPGEQISPGRAAQIVISAMNLLRSGPVTIYSLEVVRRGTHADL